MAPFPPFSRGFFRTPCLMLAGLMAVASLSACSSEPEPGPVTTASSPDVGTQAVAPMPQPALEPAPPAAPIPTNQNPEPTPVPTPAPIIIVPSPAGESPGASLEDPTSATSAGQIAESPATVPQGGPTLQIGPGDTWGDVYNSLSEEERACILNKTGEERLDQLLERPFGLAGMEQESVALLDCVSDDAARELFLADMAVQMGGLSQEQEDCLRTLLGSFSPSELAAASTGEPTPESAMLMLSFGLALVGCLPELAQEGGPPVPPNGASLVDGGMQDRSFLWSFTTGGWVLTSPAVSEGVVYAASDDYNLYALDGETGSLLWSYPTGDVIRSTPTVVDGRVLFGSNDNHLYALDAATGQELWKYDTGDWVQYSPAVGNGAVYLATQGDAGQKVVALDAATGESKWIADVAAPVDPTYTPTIISNHVYVAGSSYGEFFALDAATGDVAWQAEVGSYVESGPTVIEGAVYLTVINQAYALKEATGEAIWQVSTEEFPARDFPALVVDGIYYLAPSDKVYALDAATGDELWSYESYMLSTEPVLADGVLYGASELAEYMFALDAATGEELWTQPIEDFQAHALSVVNGILYGQLTEGYLFGIDVQDGSPIWDYQAGGFSDVRGYTVVDGVVYSAGPNNSVYAHRTP